MKRIGVLFLCAMFSFLLTTVTATAQAQVPLGTAASFAALAGSGITNTGPTTIKGDVGSHPTITQVGFASITLTGTNHGGDGVTQGAKIALRNGFLNAAGRLGATPLAGGALGGQLLTPGVYKDNGAPASLGLTGILRLDAHGDPNAVFIFQSASTLITEVGSSVVLLNGAQACNVFWQVGSAATLKTSTTFVGTILANDDISLQASATVAGRLLAGAQANGAGALTLINNTITAPVCSAAPVEPEPDVTSDLMITKNHLGNFQQGGSGFYTLTVKNIGPSETNSTVTVTDALPAGMSATGISGTGWTCNLSTLSCNRDEPLAPGASYAPITVTVDVASDAPASLTNTATVSGGSESNPDNNSSGDTTTITPRLTPPVLTPDLIITKSHTGDFPQGGSGSYSLTVKNIGLAPTTGTVSVTDTLPTGLTATGISGTGWSCILASRSCTRNDALAPGGTYPPITVTVNVADNLATNRPIRTGVTFQPGDILLSMRDGTVQWRKHDWTLVKTITGNDDGQAKGMAFDAAGNLYVTHYYGTGVNGNDIVKLDPNGNLLGSFGSGYNCNPSTIVFDRTGSAYVGHADCSGAIFKLDAHGNRLATYDIAVENRGSSHIVLDPDQCTIYYTSFGPKVKRFNVCTNTQLSDFNSIRLPDSDEGGHQFVLLPGGGMLVANFSSIVRLDASGNVVRTFDAPAETHCWLGMALDPDGTSFWGSNWCGSSATRFDLATGNVIESHLASNTGYMVKQIVVVPPDLGASVLINIAAVTGGGDVITSNNSASDATTIVAQTQPLVLSMSSTGYSVGAVWTLGMLAARPNATVRLMGSTDGQPWVVPQWTTTNANGGFSLGGAFGQGTQGSYTLQVEIDGKMSNTISFVISN